MITDPMTTWWAGRAYSQIRLGIRTCTVIEKIRASIHAVSSRSEPAWPRLPSHPRSALISSDTRYRRNPTSGAFNHTSGKRQMVRADRRDPDMAPSTVISLEHQVALKVGKGQYARVADELARSLFRHVADHLGPLSCLRDQTSHGFVSFCARAETLHIPGVTGCQLHRVRVRSHDGFLIWEFTFIITRCRKIINDQTLRFWILSI